MSLRQGSSYGGPSSSPSSSKDLPSPGAPPASESVASIEQTASRARSFVVRLLRSSMGDPPVGGQLAHREHVAIAKTSLFTPAVLSRRSASRTRDRTYRAD